MKLRYKRLSGRTHPDKNITDKERAEKAFDEVKKAYEILKDDGKRELCIGYIKAGEEVGSDDFKKAAKGGGDTLEHLIDVATMKIFAQVEKGRRDLQDKELDSKKRERENEDNDRERMR